MRISCFVHEALIGPAYAWPRQLKEVLMKRLTAYPPGDNWPETTVCDPVDMSLVDGLKIGLQRLREARFSWWDD
ncbi:MAG: hypothetical protein MOGMAGMI_00542 [Candidatus Omnitrophica bacterium]|nr:hypothetical protein [Candidatus Omnitrophota bacterium]